MPVCALISSITSLVLASDLQAKNTFAPRAASTRAVARPIPVLAPVTRTVLRSRSPIHAGYAETTRESRAIDHRALVASAVVVCLRDQATADDQLAG